MSKVHLKLLLWALLMALAAALAWSALRGAASLLSYFQTGANPGAALNIVPNVPLDLHVRLRWRPDPPDPGRSLDPIVRKEIESSYLRAWLQLNFSALRNESYGLKTYFTGPALAAVTQLWADQSASGWRLEQVDTTHELELHFYSADGAIVSFTDHDVWLSHLARRAGSGESYSDDSVADYRVVMILEDGNWRIRHWVRAAGRDVGATASTRAAPEARFVRSNGRQLELDGVFQVRGMNYHARASPGERFWRDYDGKQTRRDLELMRQLGANTVRVLVPFHPGNGSMTEAQLFDRLEDLLAAAKREELKVLVTLFGHFTDYTLLKWPGADRHLESMLDRFRDEPTILAWDLKNAPNLDYDAHGRDRVNAWLRHVARLARSRDDRHLLTVGWSGAAAAAELTDVLDVVSFHHYDTLSALEREYPALLARVSRPTLISEFGLPTLNSAFFPDGHTEQEQAAHVAGVQRLVRQSEAAGSLVWTLYDHTSSPEPEPSGRPWRATAQRWLGVVRSDGTLKPAAQLLSATADLNVRPPTAWARISKPFSLLWGTLGLISAALMLYWRMVRRRRSPDIPPAPPSQ